MLTLSFLRIFFQVYTLLDVSSQDLRSLNTLGLRSRAAALVRYSAAEQLTALSELAAQYQSVFVLGGGSNVVLAPQLESLLIKVESRGVRLLEQTDSAFIIEAQAGEAWHDFVTTCLDKGWHGLENLALIPGTVGAAPVQNIGAYGVELDQRFHSLTAWDIRNSRLVEMDADQCQFSYRNSCFKQACPGRWLILSLRFSLPKSWQPVLNYPDLQAYALAHTQGAEITPRQVFDAVCDIRRHKLPDPAVLGNAGSFFKNPVVGSNEYQAIKARAPELVAYVQPDGSYKLAAGWLIDRAGWKGRRVGAVGMHDRQALVLVNYGGADANDVSRVAQLIKADVAEQFGVVLEQEPVLVS